MNQKSFYVVFSATLLILFVLIYEGSYAFFVSTSDDQRGEDGGKTYVDTADLGDVTIIDGKNSGYANWLPGDEHDFTFQIESESVPDLCAKLIWKDVDNNWVNQNDLVYTLKDKEGNILITEKPFATQENEEIGIVKIHGKEKNDENQFTVTVTYKDTTENQIGDMNQTFQATISGELTECPTE